jgi:hypothetical protein
MTTCGRQQARFWTLAAFAVLTVAATPAGATETFVCDDGRVLTLTQEQISTLVETDPCIAKYYGREVAHTAAPAAAEAAPASPEPIAAEPQPLTAHPFAAQPLASPPSAANPYPAETASESIPADLPLPERRPEDIAAKLRSLKVDPTAPAGERKPVEIADVPSDYRNVHIINGGKSGEPQFYHHTR